MLNFKQITALETYPVRHPVLRAGRSIEDCAFEGDTLENTYHFGLYEGNKLVAVSTFVKNRHPYFLPKNQYQLRGMSVIEKLQGRGYGKEILKRSENCMKEDGHTFIWANARIIAIPFYKTMGYSTVGELFEIPTVGSHFVIQKSI